MAISTIHRLDKLVLPSSVEIVELNSARWVAGIEDILEHPAGHTHPMFVANKHQKPMIEFATPQLSTYLGAVGVGGASLGSTSTYFKKGAATGSVARATAGHKRIVIASSIAHWTQVRLPHNEKAEVSGVLTAIYDGSNDPFVYTGSVALSGNLTAGEFFGVGPCAINGTLIPGIQEITVESGVRLLQAGASSEEFDTFVGIEITNPKVTIRTLEEVNWSTLGLRGTALDGTNGVVFYARRFSANGSRVADATTSHVKFVGLLGKANPVDSSGQDQAPISNTLVCTLVASSDSVLPLVITTGSAIS